MESFPYLHFERLDLKFEKQLYLQELVCHMVLFLYHCLHLGDHFDLQYVGTAG